MICTNFFFNTRVIASIVLAIFLYNVACYVEFMEAAKSDVISLTNNKEFIDFLNVYPLIMDTEINNVATLQGSGLTQGEILQFTKLSTKTANRDKVDFGQIGCRLFSINISTLCLSHILFPFRFHSISIVFRSTVSSHISKIARVSLKQ